MDTKGHDDGAGEASDESDPALALLRRQGQPPTLENYLFARFGDDDWDPLLIESFPNELQSDACALVMGEKRRTVHAMRRQEAWTKANVDGRLAPVDSANQPPEAQTGRRWTIEDLKFLRDMGYL